MKQCIRVFGIQPDTSELNPWYFSFFNLETCKGGRGFTLLVQVSPGILTNKVYLVIIIIKRTGDY